MRRALYSTPVGIDGIVATIPEHVQIMRDEGQSERCIDYFIGQAIGRLAASNQAARAQPWNKGQ